LHQQNKMASDVSHGKYHFGFFGQAEILENSGTQGK